MSEKADFFYAIADCETGKDRSSSLPSAHQPTARNTTDRLRWFTKTDVALGFVFIEKENITPGTMESAELMLSILSGLAESESISFRKYVKGSHSKTIPKRNLLKTSYPPHGYQNMDGQMIVIPKQAEIAVYFCRSVIG